MTDILLLICNAKKKKKSLFCLLCSKNTLALLAGVFIESQVSWTSERGLGLKFCQLNV